MSPWNKSSYGPEPEALVGPDLTNLIFPQAVLFTPKHKNPISKGHGLQNL